MAEASFRALFTGEQVLHLLDDEDSDEAFDDDVFFPGSDDELGWKKWRMNSSLSNRKNKVNTWLFFILMIVTETEEEYVDDAGECSDLQRYVILVRNDT